jgi:peptide/nickel transport system substrate-binding protein
MKRWHAAALVGIVVVAAACGGDDSGTEETTAPADTSVTTVSTPEAPVPGTGDRCTADKAGAELTMAVFSETRGLDPVRSAGGGVAGGTELTAIYDRLARWNPETGEYEPWVAESFESNADFTQWTVVLRDGVTFGNGDPLTAEAVKTSIERFADPQFASHYKAIVDLVTNITVSDEHTLAFDLSAPWAGFGYLLAGQTGMVVNPAVANSMDKEAFNAAPAGAGVGAYEFQNWAPGESITLRGRDDYWGGPVCIDTLTFVPINSAQTAYEAMTTGDIQVGFLRESAVVKDAVDAGLEGYTSLQNAGEILLFNMREGAVLADVRLRQAIAMAIDPAAVDARANDGTGLPDASVIHPSSRDSTDVAPLPYDPDAAKALFEEARADGWDGKLRLLCDNRPARVDAAIAIEAMLESIGVELEVETASTPDLIRRVTVDANFDMACYGFNMTEGVLWPGFDRKVRGGASANSTGLADPAIDAAIVAMRNAESHEEMAAAVGDLQTAWNEVMPTFVIGAVAEYIGWNDDVHGVTPTVEGIMMLDGVYRDG